MIAPTGVKEEDDKVDLQDSPKILKYDKSKATKEKIFLEKVQQRNVLDVKNILSHEELRREAEMKEGKGVCKQCKLNVHAFNENGDTCLHIAARNADLDMLHCLLSSSLVNKDHPNQRGSTASQVAVDGYPTQFSKSKSQRLTSKIRRVLRQSRQALGIPIDQLVNELQSGETLIKLIPVVPYCEQCCPLSERT